MTLADEAERWSRVAEGWERQRAAIAAVGEPVKALLLELLDPKPEELILELACGNGDVGLALAQRSSDCRVIQSDVVPQMVGAARREAERLGLPNVEHRVLDASRLDLADGSVDAVVCRWGYMLLDDPVEGLAESRRVLRPGGRVALAVWGESERNPWASVIGRVLIELALIEPPDPAASAGPFALGDPLLLADTVRRAGLDVVTAAEVETAWRAPTADAYWAASLDLSLTLQGWIDGLTAEQTARARALTERRLEAFADGDGIAIPGVSRVVLARPTAAP